jgi:cellulose biosynthesis protein BcsQ
MSTLFVRGGVKLRIVVAINKGGQGKSITAKLLIQYLVAVNSQKNGYIYGCDLDTTQQNFVKSIQTWLTRTENPKIQNFEVRFVQNLDDIPENAVGVVDTPPALNDATIDAIKRADILVMPIILGQEAAQGAFRVAQLRGIERVGDIRAYINWWDTSVVQKESETFLLESGFQFLGRIPHYKRLAYNMDAKIDWYYGFTQSQVIQFVDIFKKILKK